MFKTSKYNDKKHICIALISYLMCPQKYIWNDETDEYIKNNMLSHELVKNSNIKSSEQFFLMTLIFLFDHIKKFI